MIFHLGCKARCDLVPTDRALPRASFYQNRSLARPGAASRCIRITETLPPRFGRKCWPEPVAGQKGAGFYCKYGSFSKF